MNLRSSASLLSTSTLNSYVKFHWSWRRLPRNVSSTDMETLSRLISTLLFFPQCADTLFQWLLSSGIICSSSASAECIFSLQRKTLKGWNTQFYFFCTANLPHRLRRNSPLSNNHLLSTKTSPKQVFQNTYNHSRLQPSNHRRRRNRRIVQRTAREEDTTRPITTEKTRCLARSGRLSLQRFTQV